MMFVCLFSVTGLLFIAIPSQPIFPFITSYKDDKYKY